jgi:small subunit ribosomal protein S3Ae
MREVIESRGKKLTMDQFVQEIVLGKLAADIYKVIKKICPVRRVEVRKSKIISEPAKTVEEA